MDRRGVQRRFVGVGLAGCGGSKTTENTLVYGLEAETDAGWCLSEGQLAISGMQIAKAIYDPLTMPDDEGIFRPWLAKSVEPNADYTKWTIDLLRLHPSQRHVCDRSGRLPVIQRQH